MRTTAASLIPRVSLGCVWHQRPTHPPPLATRRSRWATRQPQGNGRPQLRSAASSSSDQGQAPRFYHPPPLPQAAGAQTRLDGPEAFHALKALRLREGDVLELCDSQGRLQLARVVDVQRKSKMTLEATEEPRTIPWEGPRWTLAVALGSLKGGRADWLVEKACELGAAAVQPLLTDRSDSMGAKKAKPEGEGGREARLERVALAATKQSLRAHGMPVLEPRGLPEFVESSVGLAPLALVAVAGAPPILQVLQDHRRSSGHGSLGGSSQPSVLLVGPEGDFTPHELSTLYEAGAKPVGLGANRLRTETAAIAALSAVQFHSDLEQP